MKSYYNILSVLVRPEIEEKITIALLFVTDNKVYFECSKNKLQIAKSLIDSSLYKYLTESIRQIENAVNMEKNKLGTIFENEGLDIKFSEGYLSYMNRYSNNLISFSNTMQIDLPYDAELFSFLYKKYVDSIGIVPRKHKPLNQIKEEFYPIIESYYNTDVHLTSDQITNLPLPVNIDVIGKNEIEVFAQIIDFERPVYNIRQDVGELNFLMGAFESGKSVSFLFGDEPDKKIYPKSHDAWNDLRRWNKLNYCPLSELDKLKVYAEQHGVKPLF